MLRQAERGDPDAQYEVAIAYAFGRGTDENEERAVHWYEQATRQGHLLASSDLAFYCHEGRGLLQDTTRAVELWTFAAEQGVDSAQHSLSFVLEEGAVVRKDVTRAMELRHQAAEQGHAAACSSLANNYLYGRHVVRDESKAVELLRYASGKGDSIAEFVLASCYFDGLGVERDLQEAEALAKRSLPNLPKSYERQASRMLRRIRHARIVPNWRIWTRGAAILGWAALLFHLLTQPISLHPLALVGLVPLVPTSAFLLLQALIVLIGVLPWFQGRLSSADESIRWRRSLSNISFNWNEPRLLVWMTPAEDALFALPLIYLGMTPWNIAIASVLFGLAHYPSYSLAFCVPKAALHAVAVVFLLPTGIMTLVVGHFLWDLSLWLASAVDERAW